MLCSFLLTLHRSAHCCIRLSSFKASRLFLSRLCLFACHPQISAPTPGTASSGVTFSGASLAPYVISGILRDFTPTLNPDFKAQPDANDRGIVANLIDPDALPGAARSRLRS